MAKEKVVLTVISEYNEWNDITGQDLIVDGENVMSVWDLNDCPEDALLIRDLTSCDEVATLIKKVFEQHAGKEIVIEYKDAEEEEQ